VARQDHQDHQVLHELKMAHLIPMIVDLIDKVDTVYHRIGVLVKLEIDILQENSSQVMLVLVVIDNHRVEVDILIKGEVETDKSKHLM